MKADIDAVVAEVVEDLMGELGASGEAPIEAAIRSKAMANAREAVAERRYPSSYSAAQVSEDIEAYLYPVIRSRTLHDYSQIGMEGEVSHSEGGIVRTYPAEKRRMYPVRPFANF